MNSDAGFWFGRTAAEAAVAETRGCVTFPPAPGWTGTWFTSVCLRTRKESGGICEGILDCSFKITFSFLRFHSAEETKLSQVCMNSIRGRFYWAREEALDGEHDKRTILAFNLSERLVSTPLFQEARGISLMQKSIPHWGGHWSCMCA